MSIDVFLFSSLIVSGMLSFLSIISLYLGYSNRNNQIIIDRIRSKYYKEDKEIFGVYYSAENKSYYSFIQDYFNIFYILFISAQWIILFATLYKLSEIHCLACIVILLQFILIILSFKIRCHYYLKYKARLSTKREEA